MPKLPEFIYQKTQTGGKPQPRYVFNSYRNKKKLGLDANSRVYTLIDMKYPRMYIG